MSHISKRISILEEIDDIAARERRLRQAFAPGERFAYCVGSLAALCEQMDYKQAKAWQGVREAAQQAEEENRVVLVQWRPNLDQPMEYVAIGLEPKNRRDY